jgi:hypothetical protein
MLSRIIFISQIDFEEKPYKDVVCLKRVGWGGGWEGRAADGWND